MNTQLLIENLTNPALLFFVLGILAVMVKSDLEIPSNSSKFISLYLLFSIGFRGGQELAHETLNLEIGWSLLFGILLSLLIPVYTFFILRQRFNIYDAGAIAAAYGSISAVTFVTATAYLEAHHLRLHGHMVAVMALMEAPAIVSGLLLISVFSRKNDNIHIKTPCLPTCHYQRKCDDDCRQPHYRLLGQRRSGAGHQTLHHRPVPRLPGHIPAGHGH